MLFCYAHKGNNGYASNVIKVPIKRLEADLPLPKYAQPGDAGCDLLAAEQTVLEPSGGRGLISTGIAIALPEGYAAFIQPRSGLALKHGVTCLNTPGLIDSGYRGELKVLLVNADPKAAGDVNGGAGTGDCRGGIMRCLGQCRYA